MIVSASSDDPAINDVLYAPGGYADPVCMVHGGPSPASPFTGYTLAQYEAGNVLEGYTSEVNACADGDRADQRRLRAVLDAGHVRGARVRVLHDGRIRRPHRREHGPHDLCGR